MPAPCAIPPLWVSSGGGTTIDAITDRLTPAWLTDVLGARGQLPRGRVERLVADRFDTPPSVLARLAVAYSPDAPATAPARLLFKAPKAHKLARGGREAAFYATVAPLMPDVPLVPCYGAGDLAATGAPCLLLADVSATHAATPAPSPPQLAALIDALARLHAAWWAHPRLAEVAGDRPEDAFAADFAGNDRRYAELADLLGDRLTPEWRRIFERFLAAGPALLLDRATNGSPLTFCHPENHGGNFLLPHDPAGRVYIIDWHQYGAWWGPKDVAMLFIRAMAPEDRPLAERLLRHYHRRLLARGVADYPWDACVQDYRLAVIDTLTHLLQRPLPPPLRDDPAWVVPRLAASLREFQALGCADLLG